MSERDAAIRECIAIVYDRIKHCGTLEVALTVMERLLSTPAAPSGEYARAIEDAARFLEAEGGDEDAWLSPQGYARGIRALSPAPREDARLPSPTPTTGA